jgi:hypothetical protein
MVANGHMCTRDWKQYESIITQVACEAEHTIRYCTSRAVILSALNYIDNVGCHSEKTKRVLLIRQLRRLERRRKPQCYVCRCTERDCSICMQRTGKPCHWVAVDLCSACKEQRRLAWSA